MLNITEEARRQVGEQIPTFMRILAEQAAGGDMARLDKMFETGELHTATYLPAVLRQMKEESDKLMPHYRTTLPYWQSQSKNQGERWMRKFGEEGGESGVSRFWHVMATIQREWIDLAPKLGRAFETITWGFSNMLLIPTEFRRWATKGETDISNFFARTLGAFEGSTYEGTIKSLKELAEQLKLLGSTVKESFGDDIMVRFVDGVGAFIRDLSDLLTVLILTVRGRLGEAGQKLKEIDAGYLAEKEAIERAYQSGVISSRTSPEAFRIGQKARDDAISGVRDTEEYQEAKKAPSFLSLDWRRQLDLKILNWLDPTGEKARKQKEQWLLDDIKNLWSRERNEGGQSKLKDIDDLKEMQNSDNSSVPPDRLDLGMNESNSIEYLKNMTSIWMKQNPSPITFETHLRFDVQAMGATTEVATAMAETASTVFNDKIQQHFNSAELGVAKIMA